MVHDLSDVPEGPSSLDTVGVRFDEQRLISDAGLLLTATLAGRLGIEQLVDESVWLDPKAPGAALPGRKVMSLVHGMLAGADCIDDVNVLGAGSGQLILGHRVMAPSTLGTFLRAFTFGHVRQLDHVIDETLCRAWAAGAGPDDGPLVIDIDSFIGEVCSENKQGAGYGYTKKLGYHPLVAARADTGEVLHIRNRKGKANTQRGIARFIDELLARMRRARHTGQIIIRADSGFENHKLFKVLQKRGIEFSIAVKHSPSIAKLIEQIDQTAWVTIDDYPETGEAQVAETVLKDFRLIVRRTRLLGAQAELWPDWRYHCFATNRSAIPTLIADVDHRDHATIELAIRDLKDQALAHFPSGRMHANSAWTVIAALAHNLGRWTTQTGLPQMPVQTAGTRRRRLLQIPGRLIHTARRWTLRMPARWPWQTEFTRVLYRLRTLPSVT